jgi:hypothetical protein
MADNTWTISIPDPANPSGAVFDGLVPVYYANSYPSFGNKNQLASMANIDILDPNVLTQGPGPVALINGTQAGVVTTLIKGILRSPVSAGYCYAVGGAKFYEFTPTAVTSSAAWPHTISSGGITDVMGEDVVYYHGNLYYSWSSVISNVGDIGQYAAPTFSDDWGYGHISGAGWLSSTSHQMVVGGDDVVYFANGQYVGLFNTTILNRLALDFNSGSVVSSITWNFARLVIAVNFPNITTGGLLASGIYTWNGITPSWESDPIRVTGFIGALYSKNNITYVWWQEGGQATTYNLGYISSGILHPVRRMSGTLPLYYQVGEYNGFLAWISDGLVYLFGSNEESMIPVKLFQYTKSFYTSGGGIGCPFGSIITASYSTTNFNLCKASGYTVDSNFKTKAFRIGGAGVVSFVDLIQIETEQLATGAKCDFTLYWDKAKSNEALTQIAYSATDNATLHRILNKSYRVEDFQLYGNFANGSITNPVKIRSILIKGHIVPEN